MTERRTLAHGSKGADVIDVGGGPIVKVQLATQMGIQVNSSISYRMAVKMIRDGAIGKVTRVYAWSNKPSGKYRPTGPRPKDKHLVPATLDWDQQFPASSNML